MNLDSGILDDADLTVTLRMVLSPSLVKERHQFISLLTIYGREIMKSFLYRSPCSLLCLREENLKVIWPLSAR